jgi:hypothetical protein
MQEDHLTIAVRRHDCFVEAPNPAAVRETDKSLSQAKEVPGEGEEQASSITKLLSTPIQGDVGAKGLCTAKDVCRVAIGILTEGAPFTGQGCGVSPNSTSHSESSASQAPQPM